MTKSKTPFFDEFIKIAIPDPERLHRAQMLVTSVNFFNEDGSTKTPAEFKLDQERRKKLYGSKP